ncbi:MAG: TatD family hydrolase [Candidatus Moranbacteria bacterium]|nr:TatD family hydrolase [Candidatus Moranbacteria bacterium]
MIDTHAHLDFEQFDLSREKVLKRFFRFYGDTVVNVGVDWERNKKTLALALEHQFVYASLGFHPHEAGESFDLVKAKEYLRRNIDMEKLKIVAIGETGLDYFRMSDTKEKKFQKKLFQMQLELARDTHLPLIIHCRKAYEDLLEIINDKKYRNMKMVVHCFSGNREQLHSFLELPNLMVSFTGNITFVKDSNELAKTVEKTPLDRMMAETDCPFLAPVPMRGKRNEPLFVRYVIKRIADIKKMPFKDIELQTTKNAVNFFNLPL